MSNLDKKAIFDDRGQVKTARKIETLIGNHHPAVAWHLNRIREIASIPITLAVMGEFSAGKSTFINRLLGIDALPVAVSPKTATITRVLYGETPRIEIEYVHENQRVIREENGYDGLKKIQNAKKINDGGYQKEVGDIREVRVFVDNPLLKKFTLLDTPGFNHDAVMDEKTMNALCDAHLIVWLSDYTQLAKQTEFDRVKQIRPHNPRIYLIINKTDVHVSGTEAYQQTEVEVRQHLSDNGFIDLFYSDEIYLISCKTELPFWDGMFQRFLSRFDRIVLDEDIAISIDLISNQWEKLRDSVHQEQAQHDIMQRKLGVVRDLSIVDTVLAAHVPIALDALDADIREISVELVKHCERASQLCNSKVPSANRFVRELLMMDLYQRTSSFEVAYAKLIGGVYIDFSEKLQLSLTHLASSITDQHNEKRRKLSMLIEYLELKRSSLDDVMILPRATVEATELMNLFCCAVRGQLGDFSSAISTRLASALKRDLECDLRDLVFDESLGLVLKKLDRDLAEAATRLSRSLELMEVV